MTKHLQGSRTFIASAIALSFASIPLLNTAADFLHQASFYVSPKTAAFFSTAATVAAAAAAFFAKLGQKEAHAETSDRLTALEFSRAAFPATQLPAGAPPPDPTP